MAQFQTSLIIRATDKASATVGRVRGAFGKLGGFLASSFVFTLTDVTRVFGAVSDAMSRATEEATKAEDATTKLHTAMQLSGQFTAEAVARTESWSLALESQTTTSQEAIKEAAALGLQFGVSAEQLELFTRTALDFAPAADIGITEAVRRMGRAFSGSVEDIAKFAPKILELTKAQLAAGDATALLAEAIGGTAELLTDTYTGAIDQVETAWRKFNKAQGEAVTSSEDVRAALVEEAAAIDRLSGSLGGSGGIVESTTLLWSRFKTGLFDWLSVASQVFLTTGQVGRETVKLASASEKAAAAAKLQRSETAALSAELSKLKAETESAKDALRELGVTLDEDLVDAIEADREALDRYSEQLSQGAIKVNDFNEAERILTARIEENEAKLRSQTGATIESTEAFEQFTAQTLGLTAAFVEYEGQLVLSERAVLQLDQAERQRASASGGGGGSSLSGVDIFAGGGILGSGLGGGPGLFEFSGTSYVVTTVNDQFRDVRPGG